MTDHKPVPAEIEALYPGTDICPLVGRIRPVANLWGARRLGYPLDGANAELRKCSRRPTFNTGHRNRSCVSWTFDVRRRAFDDYFDSAQS
jgi:hypothetical protein